MVTETKDKKSIKLANWNTFIIDRLNQMYTKGEMCDVTLKFSDDQSIQGHKLMLAACTNFFNNLTSSAAELVLKMPTNIKSDHVRPLINFMYSGRLEYTTEDHDQVVKAAKHLGMNVLTELLQVQLNTPAIQKPGPGPAKTIKKYVQKPSTPQQANNSPGTGTPPPPIEPLESPSTPRLLPGKKLPFWKKRKTNQLPEEFYHSINKKPPPVELPTPTRFVCADDDILPEVQISEVDLNDISYETKVTVKPVNTPKPVITEDSIQELQKTQIKPCLILKRPRVSEVVHSRDDDDDYDDGHFETIHDLEEYNEDEEDLPKLNEPKLLTTPPKPILKNHETSTPTPSKKVRFSISDQFTPANNELTTPSTSAPDSTPCQSLSNTHTASATIPAPVTTSNSTPAPAINHAKIIGEVLKKFPHMVKNNKNIKLKIQMGGNLPVTYTPTPSPAPMETSGKGQKKVQYVVLKSDFASVKKEIKAEPTVGAENITGPWTCVSCGDESGPKNFESYYTYRKHLQEIHNERIDARICEHCGFKASKRNLHLYHLYTKHNIAPPRNINFPKCDQCNYIALSESLLIKHRSNHTGLINKEYVCKVCNASFKSNGALTGHMQTNLHHMDQTPKKDYECEFCGKIFNRNINLKAHKRTAHQEETRKMYEDEERIDNPADSDKIITEQRNQNVMEVIEVPVYDSVQNNKTFYLHQEMTILAESPAVPLMPSSESEAMNNVATGIATSINITDRNMPNDVIVINENSEIILRGTPATYVVNQDGSYSLQEYIVPEIMSDSRQMYTTALVSSAPTTGISYVNSDNLSIITSGTDHTYADGMKINGQVSTEPQVNLVSSNGQTVIASQADTPIIMQEPIIVSGDWVQTIGAQQGQSLNLGQGQKFEIIAAPAVTQLSNAVQVSLPEAKSKMTEAPPQAQIRTAQTLVNDWGDADDDTQEEESQDEDSEMKPSRPTLELAESHELI